MITEKELEKNDWIIIPNGVWFGVDFAESHKVNVLDILTDLLDLDTDAEGYNFVVCAYKKQENEDESF
tara:strand:+ start:437 stop:640 length:204 start_codon:yes stop_codon:yes gene_type:complete